MLDIDLKMLKVQIFAWQIIIRLNKFNKNISRKPPKSPFAFTKSHQGIV